MERKLLIHSMGEFSSITLPILDVIQATTIGEVGSEHGGNSKVLYDWLQPRQGRLLSIDPTPSPLFTDWQQAVSDVVTHIPKTSLDAIPTMTGVDAWFIDGDHNWYTVYHELQAIYALSQQEKSLPVIFLHDVSWPCARRDFYYAPDRIPENFRLPHVWDKGVNLDSAGVVVGGFRGEGQFAVALTEGGARNGVLTAVEDFVAAHAEEFYWALVPAVFGLGVLFPRAHPQASQICQLLAPYNHNRLIAVLEENRLHNYITVLGWQDKQSETKAMTAKQMEIQQIAQEMLQLLSDDAEHPDVWGVLRAEAAKPYPQDLLLLTHYLGQLLMIPQTTEAEWVVNVLHAVCIAYLGQSTKAAQTLVALAHEKPNSRLIKNALQQVQLQQGVAQDVMS